MKEALKAREAKEAKEAQEAKEAKEAMEAKQAQLAKERAQMDRFSGLEWIEAAWRGGRERHAVRELLRPSKQSRAYGKSIIRLATDVVNLDSL